MTQQSIYNKAWRETHPMKYCYMTLRDNARRRGKEFTITFEQLRHFCYRTKYIKRKGIYRDNYSIDRIDNNKGYVPGNLKCVPVPVNSAKGIKRVVYMRHSDSKFKVI